MQTEKFKKALEAELGLVTKELKTVGVKNPDNPREWDAKPDEMDTTRGDDNETADMIESLDENEAVLGQLEIRKINIEDALKRIANGTYGVCKVCKKPIEEKRLEANPAAETCIEHKNN